MKRFKPGAAFSDFVILGSASKAPNNHNSKSEIIFGDWLWLGIVVLFGLLLVRLISLQIFEGEKYRILANENRISTIILPATRGQILDQNDKPLEDTFANSTLVGFTG